jgi:hypothetical protein
MPLPTFTPEQRAKALARAAEVRTARSALLASVSNGEENVPALLDRAKSDPVIGRLKVSTLIRAVPGMGTKRVAALLAQAGIADTRRVAGLTPRQREQLLAGLPTHT